MTPLQVLSLFRRTQFVASQTHEEIMELVQVEQRGGVIVVSMQDGRTNNLSRLMTDNLTEVGEELATGSSGVVLTGTGRFFSAGLDLQQLLSIDRTELSAFIDDFEKMCMSWFSLPRPVVAAINGHAIAGGTVLALTADRIVGARGASRMGLTELALGVSLPVVALELARFHLPPPSVTRVVLEAETFPPDECLALGLAHKLVPAESLLAEACGLAAKLAKSPGRAFRNTKEDLRREYLERMRSRRAAGHEKFVDALFDPSVRSHVQTTLDATKSGKP